MALHPYLFFNGNCEAAIEFYKAALGAEVHMISRFAESPEPLPAEMVPKGWEQKVMHVALTIAGSQLMACDSPQAAGFNGIQLSINVPSLMEAEKAFKALSDGGAVTMPLAPTFWSPGFGMVTDRFGVPWMVNVDH